VKPALRVLVLSDGVPGHVSQSRGLARLLGERFEAVADEVEVRLRAKPLARRLLPLLVGGGDPLARLRCFHCIAALPSRPDVVISAGGNTAFANVLLARHFQCPNVFMGSRRRLPSESFSAHLTLEPTFEPSNVVMDVAPGPRSAAEVREAGAAFVATHGLAGDRLWLMACGGDGAGLRYRATHWTALGAWMNELAASHGARWLVSTSRRTGAAAEQALRAALDPARVAYAVWWSAREERILGSLLGAAERAFVTADSMSMISESIAAGKPVAVVRTGSGEPGRRYLDALAKFERMGLSRGVAVGADAPPLAPPGTRHFDALLDAIEPRILPC
jgi:hypothetical protein